MKSFQYLKQCFVLWMCMFTLTQAACNNFTVARRAYGDTVYTMSGPSPIRVSATVVCRSGGNNLGAVEGGYDCNSTTCALGSVPDLLVLLNRTLNISASAAVSKNLFDLARRDFQIQNRINFNASRAYSFTEVSTCLPPGSAGYWGFTPLYRCIDGTVSQCSGDGFPADGTAVQLCGVGTLVSPDGQADGRISIVNTSGLGEEPAPTNATLPADQSSMAYAGKHFIPLLLAATALSHIALYT